jgi:hypothetical protein
LGGIDLFPLGLWDAVALTGKGRIVILWYFSWLVLRQREEDGESEGDNVGRGLAAVLEERVVVVGLGEGDLIGVGEVEVVEGEEDGGEVVRAGFVGLTGL